MQHLFDELGDLKYRPCPLLRKMVRAGPPGGVKSGAASSLRRPGAHHGRAARRRIADGRPRAARRSRAAAPRVSGPHGRRHRRLRRGSRARSWPKGGPRHASGLTARDPRPRTRSARAQAATGATLSADETLAALPGRGGEDAATQPRWWPLDAAPPTVVAAGCKPPLHSPSGALQARLVACAQAGRGQEGVGWGRSLSAGVE